MSTVAKVFVVVNLILAVVCFGSAATLLGAQDDYKVAVEKASREFTAYKDIKDRELQEFEQKFGEQSRRASEAMVSENAAKQAASDASTQLSETQRMNQQLLALSETLSKELAAANKINEDNRAWLQRNADEAKKAADDAIAARKALDDEIANRVTLEQQIANQNERVEVMAAERGDLDKKVRDLEFKLKHYEGIYGTMGPSGQGAEGNVLNVRDTLVQISVGSKDRVRPGDTYHIRRGGTYVGMIRITKVEKDSAVGEFDRQYPGEGAPPQKGDTAYPSR
jgi:hypothetical protein